MRSLWVFFAAAVLLSACQQPGSAPEPHQAKADYRGGSGSDYFEPEVDAVMSQIGGRLAGSCFNQAQNRDKLEDCIRGHFVTAFDDSGLGRSNCDFHTALADFLSCVTIGNAMIELRHRLSDDSPVPAGFWSGDSAMSQALVASVVKSGIDACGVSGETEQITDCIEKWFEGRLALPQTMIDRCNSSAPEDDRVRCLGEAYMLRFLQDRTARLGAVST